MGTYLVTGVAGFIGSAVAAQLLSLGHRVVGVDNLSTGFLENIPEGVEFFSSDCQNHALYKNDLPQEKFDAIFHIAGQSSGEISFDDPVYDLRTNAESTLLLLKFAMRCGCRRFIYASTMSAYGVQEDKPVRESAQCRPESFYGVGKLASERYMRIYERYGIHSTALRLFNVYGPGQNMSNLRQGMVSIFMAMMLNDKHITIKGSPDRYRDFIYIDDVVNAFLLCLNKASYDIRVVNIGTGIRTTVGELIDTFKKLYDKPFTVEFSGSTSGDILGVFADTTLAKTRLGFTAQVSLEQGLSTMLGRYYK